MTIDDVPQDSLKSKLEEYFSSWNKDNEICLGRKTSLLIDFLSRLPYMMSKAFSPEKIRSSFIRNGMIDKKDYLWPDLVKMIHTKRGIVTNEDHKLIIGNLPKLIKVMRRDGHIA